MFALGGLTHLRELAERAYFVLCLAVGRLLRSARYSHADVVRANGEYQVRKRRLFYAPLLIRLGGPLLEIMNTGVRVLPQRDWEQRERAIYANLYGASISIEPNGVLLLPLLSGTTLAALLEDRKLTESARHAAIDRAVTALAEFHRLGFTHADAMAENVLVDLDAGGARWFDFETVHDSARPIAWRRADDVRALLVSCVMRTNPESFAGTVNQILDGYQDTEVTRFLSQIFSSAWRRPLPFHLAQAGLSLQAFRAIDRLLRVRARR